VKAPARVVEATPGEAVVIMPPVVARAFNSLHHMFGHAHFDTIKRSVPYYNIKLQGDVKTCVACVLVKKRQKNKIWSLPKSLKPGDCI
jgi:hypothetical protein